MKVRYTFAVKGTLRFPDDLAFEYKSRFYEFRARDGFVSGIAVTVNVPDEDHWPSVTKEPSPGIAAHIHIREPYIAFIQQEVRQLGALLALYGLTSVDVNYPKVTWLPQSDAEKKTLPVREFETSFARPDPMALPLLPPDLMARCVVAAFEGTVSEVPLLFFRRGREDMQERRYIEACYDYYFVFETLFGSGKYISKAVKGAFRKSPDLQKAILGFMQDAPQQRRLRREFPHKYRERLEGKTTEAVSDYLVSFRGFIHHHSAGRRGIWHPDRQEEFEFEAILFEQIAFGCAMTLAVKTTFDPTLDLQSIKFKKRVR